jgi:hypothetical protein
MQTEEAMPLVAIPSSFHESSELKNDENDEHLLDSGSSSSRDNMDVNVIFLSSDYSFIGDDERVAQFDFVPKNVVFQKPKKSDNHLKALYLKGNINGRSVSRMLVDGGAIVDLMLYSPFKKSGGSDSKLIKTHMTINGVGGGEPMSAKGVASMELTIGSKTLATTIFLTETQGNFASMCAIYFASNVDSMG